MRRGSTKFIAVWGTIAVVSILGIVTLEVWMSRCHCSPSFAGVQIESLPPILAGAAIGGVLMVIAGAHYRKQGL